MTDRLPPGKPSGFPRRRPSNLKRALFLCSALACAALLFGIVHSARRQALAQRCAMCESNLKWISTSLHYYHEKHGHFPPAYIADKNGKPMHSWRILLLEISNESVYGRYNFDEAWDGPNNRKLASLMPEFYACPNESEHRIATTSQTSYLALTGLGTAFPGEKSTRVEDIADGLGRTVFLVETKDSGINWMEPRDMDVSKLRFPAQPDQHPALSSNDPGGPALVFGDCRLVRMQHPIQQEGLNAMRAIRVPHGEPQVGPASP